MINYIEINDEIIDKYKLNNRIYINNQIQFIFVQKEAIYKILIG